MIVNMNKLSMAWVPATPPAGSIVVAATWPFAGEAARTAAQCLGATNWAVGAESDAIMEALVAGLGVAEVDEAIGPYFVGVGGLPNAAGVLELDAALSRGKDCRFGAVLGLQRYWGSGGSIFL